MSLVWLIRTIAIRLGFDAKQVARVMPRQVASRTLKWTRLTAAGSPQAGPALLSSYSARTIFHLRMPVVITRVPPSPICVAADKN